MRINKRTAAIVGILFILAAVTAIIGLALYQPILTGPDFLVKGYENGAQVVLGAICELILACSIVGISILFFPYLKRQNESIALGYVCFRMLEAVLITIGIVSVLSLLSLSQDYVKAVAPNASSYQAVGKVLIGAHDWTFMLGPNFMLGINTLMCSSLLYQSKLVPRFIAVMGMIGATLTLTAAVLEMFGIILQLSTWGALLGIPVFAYEMTLAVWLIVKGFNPAAIASLLAKTGVKEGLLGA